MFSFRFSNLSLRWMALIAWCIAIAFTAWVIAALISRFIAPPPIDACFVAVSDPHVAAQQIIARSPMIAGALTREVLAVQAVASHAKHKLIGVATGFGEGAGFALLRHNGGPVLPAIVGETLAPGIKLLRLHADSVDIDYGGRVETVRLTREHTVPSPAAPVRVGSIGTGR